MGWEQSVVSTNYTQELWGLALATVVFRSGDQHVVSERTMAVLFSVPEHGFMAIECHLVRADVPMLLGLDVPRDFRLILDFRNNYLRSTNPRWNLPFTYTVGHAFVSPPTLFKRDTGRHPPTIRKARGEVEVRYTAAELQRLHLHFYHPSSEKLFSLLRRADPTRASDARVPRRVVVGPGNATENHDVLRALQTILVPPFPV